MCHVPGPRGFSPGYFCPSRVPSQSGCSKTGCANTNDHRPTKSRSCFPLQKQYIMSSNKDSILFRLRLICIRVWLGGFTHFLNQIQRSHKTGEFVVFLAKPYIGPPRPEGHGDLRVDLRGDPLARNDYDEEAAYESVMNPEPGFQSGPGDSVDADKMASCLLDTKSSPPRGGSEKSI